MSEQLYDLRLQLWNSARGVVKAVNKAAAQEFGRTLLRRRIIPLETQIVNGLENECTANSN